ncbi:5-amino-6-(5-phospho-D-ribitylamino)uracil phosphatase YcsE [Paraliobacillus quinghaiensis]|uniref:5-amino-6-(5-phospho-D-ribitylamino)uracil phosphatase YcsE n=1 Tax=Paraliobacillus quinghaiensis TaxID=470815 RepID=A0A917TNT4_9BACI|nr:Cof-type HAD-IIB family hydrolase [Paraliobacillus quinghaiensis]GGM30265.1 5-amino-6-(5-phospho-D-ribitylamino)uracil phosphatase YcsE [Paraliobacillus quinghaiensis]
MDKPDIRMIALDMDGTVLDTEMNISKKNEQAIKRAIDQGVEVVFATGRHCVTCTPYAEALGVNYMITVNGGEIWTTDGELIARQSLAQTAVKKYKEIYDKYTPWTWLVSPEKVWRNEIPENFDDQEWLKFGIDTTDDAIRAAILEELSSETTIELSNSSLTNIEINAMGINKAQSIEKICERIGINMDQVMAVGDSLNDIKMIQHAGLGVAMGNAQEEVKKVADWVAPHHTEDGVSEAIEYWVLK